ncbi:MAG: sulfurtransferase TusA family protein [Planctomycetaceae bacterium]|nr:sulfurtransferase TusA family protein [Planctomycetaceae bacterium]
MNPTSANDLPTSTISADAEWDAGDLACGDLVLELLKKVRAMPPGAVLKLIANDPAARIDIGAWCRVTKNRLVAMSPPVFFIQRKEN